MSERIVNSYKALGHMRPDSTQKWVVYSFLLKENPKTLYGLINVLRSFPTQKEADDYARHIRNTTMSKNVVSRPACTWLQLSIDNEIEYRPSPRDVADTLDAEAENVEFHDVVSRNAEDNLSEAARRDPVSVHAFKYYLNKMVKTKSQIEAMVETLGQLQSKYKDYVDSATELSHLKNELGWNDAITKPIEKSIDLGYELLISGREPILLNNIQFPFMRGGGNETADTPSPVNPSHMGNLNVVATVDNDNIVNNTSKVDIAAEFFDAGTVYTEDVKSDLHILEAEGNMGELNCVDVVVPDIYSFLSKSATQPEQNENNNARVINVSPNDNQIEHRLAETSSEFSNNTMASEVSLPDADSASPNDDIVIEPTVVDISQQTTSSISRPSILDDIDELMNTLAKRPVSSSSRRRLVRS